MDIFQLLDETVRGVVNFVYDFVRTTGRLVTKPIAGPLDLWRDYQRSDAKQVSPLTYLTLMFIIVAVLVPRTEPFTAATPSLNILPSLATMLTTGSITNAVIPIVAGAVAAAVLIEFLLRLLGLILPRGLRRERFIGVMEYEFGILLPLIAAATVPAAGNLSEDDPVTQLGVILLMIPFYAAAFVMIVHFYAQLLRRPGWYRITHRLPRRLKRAWRERQKGWLTSWLRDRLVHWPSTMKFLFVGYFKLFLRLFLLYPPLFIIMPALVARGLTTNWLVKQQEPAATVTLLDLRCDLAAQPNWASALAWNSSSKPAVNWLNNLDVQLTGWSDEHLGSLKWDAHWTGARKSDLLMPGETFALSGPLSWPAGKGFPVVASLDDARCNAARAANGVTIRSEGNALRLPPSLVVRR